MIFLLVITWLVAAIGVGLQVAMMRRDDPTLGMFGLFVMLVAGTLGTAYGTLTST